MAQNQTVRMIKKNKNKIETMFTEKDWNGSSQLGGQKRSKRKCQKKVAVTKGKQTQNSRI